jgi:hypothetical protein
VAVQKIGQFLNSDSVICISWCLSLRAFAGEILKSPFGKLTFKEQFIADVLTSLVKVNVDVERSICFYITGSWLNSAPPIIPGKNHCIPTVPGLHSLFTFTHLVQLCC